MPNEQPWDAIVVGAGPAGCGAAYDLAAAGRRVLLVDRAEFPRAKACAGGLTMKAVRALRYSVAPVVRKSVCDAVLEHSSGPGQELHVARRRPLCLMTVRAELDAYCLDRTRARGAIFRRVDGLTGISEETNRVLLHLGGEAEPLTARFVIGADGVHSRVRALAFPSAGWFRTGFALEANVPYSATRRAFPLVFDFSPAMRGYGWLFPRNDHVNVGLYTAGPDSGAGQAREREDAGPTLDRAALTAYIKARCGTEEHDRAVGQFLGLGAAGYEPRASRVLLAGDAAGFVDPLTGEGIHGAILSGQTAAAAVLAGLRAGGDVARHYSAGLRRQRADLRVSEVAAQKFYSEPERGFRLMRLPLVGRAVLHAYSDGTSLTQLARGVALAGRVARMARQ